MQWMLLGLPGFSVRLKWQCNRNTENNPVYGLLVFSAFTRSTQVENSADNANSALSSNALLRFYRYVEIDKNDWKLVISSSIKRFRIIWRVYVRAYAATGRLHLCLSLDDSVDQLNQSFRNEML